MIYLSIRHCTAQSSTNSFISRCKKTATLSTFPTKNCKTTVRQHYLDTFTTRISHHIAAVYQLSKSLQFECSLSTESLSSAASAFSSLCLNLSISSRSCQSTNSENLVNFITIPCCKHLNLLKCFNID